MKCSYCSAEIGNAQVCPYCQSPQAPSIAGLPRSFGQGGGVDDVGKELGKPKTQKAIKSFDGMLGKLTKVNPYTIALSKIMILIEPFINLIDLFNPVLEYLAGIFEQMLIPVIKALMPLIELFIDILDELKPTFMLIGEILGNYVGKIVQAIIPIIMALFEVVKPFLPLIEELTPLFDLLFLLMFPFLPLLQLLIPLIELLVPVIWFVVHGIRALVRAINDIERAVDNAIGWINDLIDALNSGGGGGGGGGGGDDEDWWGIFQEGTPFVPETGPAIVHRGEAIFPAEANPFMKGITTTAADPELLEYSEGTFKGVMLLNEKFDKRVRRSPYGYQY